MSEVVKQTQTVNTLEELHIVVLVAGTTDPVNTHATTKTNNKDYPFIETEHRANSYPSTSLYWDDSFFQQIMELQKSTKEYKPMVIFDKHGWSGDNKIENREKAGAYLVNRLCGANNLVAYYKAYLNYPVTFHLVGHSHGGNVINEMTKQMDALGNAWPIDWQVKSIVYLSTPFFNKIHQVKVTKKTFHKDAEVLHLYNDFDLTQRMLADFSMEPLAKATMINDIESIKANIEKIQTFQFPKISSQVEDIDDRWYGVDLELTMSYSDGKNFYDKFITLFTDANNLFKSIENFIDSLSKETSFNVSEDIKKQMGEDILKYKRTIIPQSEKKELFDTINLIQEEIKKNISSFQARNIQHAADKSNYLVKNIFEDFYINDLVKFILQFLDLDQQTLISKGNSLWNILFRILKSNIEDYDNTYQDPKKQFEGSHVKVNEGLNVTERDEYFKAVESKNYYSFIKYIEDIEKKCESELNQTNLLDLIFTLIQQFGVIYEYKGVGFGTALKGFAYYIKARRLGKLNFKASEFENRVFELANLVTKFQEIFKARDFGGVVDSTHKLTPEQEVKNNDDDPNNDTLIRGSIPYLLMESHSTSRRVLHKEVRGFLRRLGPQR